MPESPEPVKPQETPALHRKLSREEIREALICPICKKHGALLDEKCKFCGAYQNEEGLWVVPAPKEIPPVPPKKEETQPKKSVPWYEEEL